MYQQLLSRLPHSVELHRLSITVHSGTRVTRNHRHKTLSDSALSSSDLRATHLSQGLQMRLGLHHGEAPITPRVRPDKRRSDTGGSPGRVRVEFRVGQTLT